MSNQKILDTRLPFERRLKVVETEGKIGEMFISPFDPGCRQTLAGCDLQCTFIEGYSRPFWSIETFHNGGGGIGVIPATLPITLKLDITQTTVWDHQSFLSTTTTHAPLNGTMRKY